MKNRRDFLVKSASTLAVTFIIPSLLTEKAHAKKPLAQKIILFV